MRCKSSAPVVVTAILGSVASVALAGALSASSDRVFLPVVLLNEEPFALVFLALPIAAVVGVGLGLGCSRRALWVAGVLTALLTTALALGVWIAWVFVDCGVNLERCVR
jgi:hypothetical protein